MLFMGRVNNTSWRLAQKPKVYVMDFIFYLLIKRKYKLQSNPNFAKNIVFKCHSTTKHQKRSLVGCRERGETSFQQSSKLCRFPESPLQQIKSGIGGLHGKKTPTKSRKISRKRPEHRDKSSDEVRALCWLAHAILCFYTCKHSSQTQNSWLMFSA